HEFVLLADCWTASEATFPAGARVEVVGTCQQPTRAASAAGSRGLLDLCRLSWAAARLPLDAFFFPAVYSYFPLTTRVPTAVTFHDAIAEHFPSLIFPRRRSRWLWNLKPWLARQQADRIITVSADARAQVARAFNIPTERITVVTEGPGAAF